jgi:hypothetical protein
MTMDYFSRLLPQLDPVVASPSLESRPQLNSRDETEPIEIHEITETTDEPASGPQKAAGENGSVKPISPSNPGTALPTPSTVPGTDRKSQGSAPSAAEKLTPTRNRQGLTPQQEHDLLSEHPPSSPLSMRAGSADPVLQNTAVQPAIAARPLAKKAPSVIDQTPDTQKHAVSQLPSHQIRQTISNAVRKWVAAQTGITTEKQRAQVSQKVVAEVDRTLRRLSPIQPLIPRDESKKMVAGDFEDLAMHNLTLSIGPINITMEPAEKKRSSRVPQPRQPARPASEQAASRLSRHYIVR